MDQGQALLDALGEWDDSEVSGVERCEGDPDEIHVSLKPREDVPLYCNCCGWACERVHEHVQRAARDLPLFDAITYLEIIIYRVWCDHCGGPKRMRIDKRALKARLDPADFSHVRVIGMDEFALHEGHRYSTVVVDPIRKRVLWVAPVGIARRYESSSSSPASISASASRRPRWICTRPSPSRSSGTVRTPALSTISST